MSCLVLIQPLPKNWKVYLDVLMNKGCSPEFITSFFHMYTSSTPQHPPENLSDPDDTLVNGRTLPSPGTSHFSKQQNNNSRHKSWRLAILHLPRILWVEALD
jgi:hypothetical protein